MKTKQQQPAATTSPTMKARQLTVSSRISSAPFTNLCYPQLRLSGRWLEQSGFESGQQVIVTCRKNELVITLAEEPVIEWPEEVREYL